MRKVELLPTQDYQAGYASGVAPKLHQSQLRSAAVGKAARLLIYRQDATCHLVIP